LFDAKIGKGEVDKNDPEKQDKRNSLYITCASNDASNVYNMDKKGLLFQIIPMRTLSMPGEYMATTRGIIRIKEKFTLVNATGYHEI
jgi:hypothetical protein